MNISKEAFLLAEENEKVTDGLYKEGKASEFDKSKIVVQKLDAQAKLTTAKHSLQLSKEKLAFLMNLPPDKKFEIKGELKFVPFKSDVKKLIGKAVTQRTDIKIYGHQIKALQHKLAIIRTLDKPSLSVGAGYTMLNDRLGFTIDEWYKTWNIGIRLDFPLFDGFATQGKQSSVSANIEALKLKKIRLEQSIELEVRQSVLLMKDAKERISVQKHQVNTAQENLRIANERYRLGLMSYLELKDAQLSLTQAKTSYSKTLYDYIIAKSSLCKAIGENKLRSEVK